MFFCCCSSSRKEGEDENSDDQMQKLKNVNRILIEFVQEESRLGLREQPCIEMIEKILLASTKGEIPKKEIIQIYKSIESVNQNVIKNFLIQEFFFTDNTRQKYDFNKMVLFNLLYSGGKENEKSNFLFNVLENPQSSCVHNHSQKVMSTIKYLTAIPCLVVGETLNSARRFTSDQDDQDFQELLSLYSTNSSMIQEFAVDLINMYLFPSSEEKQYLMRQDFLKKMEDCGFIFIKPNELRKKYTDYVFQNKSRALLPTRNQLRNTQGGLRDGDYEDSKRQTINNTRLTGESFYERADRDRWSIKKSPRDSQQQKQHRSSVNRSSKKPRQSSNKGLQSNNSNYQSRDNSNSNKNKNSQSKLNRNDNDFYGEEEEEREQQQEYMNRTVSDKSMAIYRYEDRSQRHSQSAKRKGNVNNYNAASVKKQNSRDNSMLSMSAREVDVTSPVQSPGGIYQERLTEKEMQRQLNIMRSNQNLQRESNDTTTSFSNHNMKKYPSVYVYLKETYGDQFVEFVKDLQAPFDTVRQERLAKNLEQLKSGTKTLDFPDYNSYPYHVREIFEYFKALINKDDLIAFSEGKLYKENIINVYMKILEKTNLVLQSSYNYHKAITRQSADQYSHLTQPSKILYFSTSYSKKLNNQAYLKDCINSLKDFYKNDIVILPFFFDTEVDKRSLIVSIKIATSTVDLYDREREEDNHDISDTVLHMMDLASHIIESEFNEDQIDGGVEGVCVTRDEDMIVAVCHIAECFTLGRPVDMEIFNLKQERLRILDAFLSLLNFQ